MIVRPLSELVTDINSILDNYEKNINPPTNPALSRWKNFKNHLSFEGSLVKGNKGRATLSGMRAIVNRIHVSQKTFLNDLFAFADQENKKSLFGSQLCEAVIEFVGKELNVCRLAPTVGVKHISPTQAPSLIGMIESTESFHQRIQNKIQQISEDASLQNQI